MYQHSLTGTVVAQDILLHAAHTSSLPAAGEVHATSFLARRAVIPASSALSGQHVVSARSGGYRQQQQAYEAQQATDKGGMWDY